MPHHGPGLREEGAVSFSLGRQCCPSMPMVKPSKPVLRAQKPPKMLCCLKSWFSPAQLKAREYNLLVPTRTDFFHTLFPHGKGLQDMLLSPSQTHSKTCSCCCNSPSKPQKMERALALHPTCYADCHFIHKFHTPDNAGTKS